MIAQPDSVKSLIAAWAVQEYKNYQANKDRMGPVALIAYIKFFVEDCERRNSPEFGYQTAKALLDKVKYDHPQTEDSAFSWIGGGG